MSGELHTLDWDSQEFIRLVKERILYKLNFYEIAILQELMQPKPDYETLLKTLRNQQKDNDLVMSYILGHEASQLLEKILP